MKPNIHPAYAEAKVVCACGNTFTTKSTKSEIHVETCEKCHPFYTGNANSSKAKGAVEKFNKKYGLNDKKEEEKAA